MPSDAYAPTDIRVVVAVYSREAYICVPLSACSDIQTKERNT